MSSMIYMSTYTAVLEAFNEFDAGIYGAAFVALQAAEDAA